MYITQIRYIIKSLNKKGDIMIIDTHAHIGKLLTFNMPEENVLYSMKKYGIDFSLVSSVEAAENSHSGRKIPRIFQKSQNRVLEKSLGCAREQSDKIHAS